MKRYGQIICSLLVLLLVFSGSVVAAAEEGAPAKVDTKHVYQSQVDNPRAVIKDGLFVRFDKDRVVIHEGSKAKERSYLLNKDFKITYEGVEIDWKALGLIRIPPHSFVKLVMIEGEIVEVNLVEVSS